MNTSFILNYAPLLVLLVSWLLVYAGLNKLKVPGSQWILALLSFLVSFMLISSKKLTSYVMNMVPWFAVLSIIGMFMLVILVLVAKDLSVFQKPISWIIFALGILSVILVSFNTFPTFYHMLPATSDSYLNSQLVEVKDFIYSSTFKQNLVFWLSTVLVFVFLVKAK